MSEQANMAAHYEHDIPEGYEARIEGNKVIIELKESEDDKIRKEILEYAKDEIRSYNNMVSGDYDSRDKEDKKMHEWWKKVVAYLEKQKEQKPIKRPKFKIGDVVKFKGFGDEPENDTPLKIVGYDNELYLFDNGTTDLFSEQDLYELVEQKPIEKQSMLKKLREHLANIPQEQLDAEFEALKDLTIDKPVEWGKKDKECRDELIQYIEQRIGDGTTGQFLWKKWHSWLNSLPERFNLSSEQKWSEKDKDMFLSAIEYIQTYPAHRQSVVDWLKNLPNRFYPQPKTAEWSEEDERHINSLLIMLEADEELMLARDYYKTLKDWLKSLRPQPHWKPSEEQIEALEWMLTTVSFKDGGYGVILKSLVTELKKL